jgi:hypothetical protein
LEFSLAQPEMFLAAACDKYKELAAIHSAETIVFMLWFANQNPKVLKDEVAQRIRQVPLPRHYGPTQRREFFEDYVKVATLFMAIQLTA